MKAGRDEEALAAYDKSLTESREKDVAQKKLQLERDMKRKKDEAYLNPELSAEHRTKGNEHFTAQRYPEAIAEYTESIKRNPKDSAPYGNRAAAYIKLGELPSALKDCEKAIELKPDYCFVLANISRSVVFLMCMWPVNSTCIHAKGSHPSSHERVSQGH